MLQLNGANVSVNATMAQKNVSSNATSHSNISVAQMKTFPSPSDSNSSMNFTKLDSYVTNGENKAQSEKLEKQKEMKLENMQPKTVKAGIQLKTVETQHANKYFVSTVNEMSEEMLSSINPHDLDGLVEARVVADKQYDVETQMKKPLILENKHDLGISIDDLKSFYNPDKYASSGARVQTNATANASTNATAKINPIHIDGLVNEP